MNRRISIYVGLGIAIAAALGVVVGSAGIGSIHADAGQQHADTPTTSFKRKQPAHTGLSVASLEQLRSDLIKLRNDTQRNHSHDGINQKLGGFERRLTSLDSTLTAIQSALENLPGNDAPAEIGFDQPAASPEEQAAAMERKAQLQLDTLEDQLNHEAVDSTWASEKVTALHTAFQREELLDIQVLETKCAATLCRLDLAFDPSVPPEDSLQRLSHHRPWDGQAFVTVGSDGHARIYVSRNGYDLPEIDVEGESQ